MGERGHRGERVTGGLGEFSLGGQGSVTTGRARESRQKQEVAERLLALWEQHPQLRLGQLIGNVYHSTDAGGAAQYYAEDYTLITTLEAFYEGREA